jgi:hypothetical protein
MALALPYGIAQAWFGSVSAMGADRQEVGLVNELVPVVPEVTSHLDAVRIDELQRQAMTARPVAMVQAHYASLLSAPGIARLGDPNLTIYALVLRLQEMVLELLSPSDPRRVDPLAHYATTVAPLLERLNASTTDETLAVDLGQGLIGYNWFGAELANGYSAWRWMGAGERSGLLIALPLAAHSLRIVAAESQVGQVEGLSLSINGVAIDAPVVTRKGHFHMIEAKLPDAVTALPGRSGYPFGFLELATTLHRVPAPEASDQRRLGLGIGLIELLRD